MMYFLSRSYRQDALAGDVEIETGVRHTACFPRALLVLGLYSGRGTADRVGFLGFQRTGRHHPHTWLFGAGKVCGAYKAQ